MWGKRLCSIIGDVLSHQGSYWCRAKGYTGYAYFEYRNILDKFEPRLTRRGWINVG